MTRRIVLSTVTIAVLGSAAILAQAQQQPLQMQPDLATFFVAENPTGTGNLGGLQGADQICQQQAQAIGGRAATRTWRAYLSQEQRGTRIAVIWDSGFSGYGCVLSSIETAAKAMAVELIPVPVRSPAEVAQAIPAFAAQPNGGLLVLPIRVDLSIPIYKLAVEYKLPSTGSAREAATNGALVSYGTNMARF